jgi:hypothetical protein
LIDLKRDIILKKVEVEKQQDSAIVRGASSLFELAIATSSANHFWNLGSRFFCWAVGTNMAVQTTSIVLNFVLYKIFLRIYRF